ncbi:TetR family transcriptional regulator [Streptomyces sp. NPDC002838]|uniref:TetR/AcrR family transcriptional regulator n=1 Tax=Streptomyces sp. NPDC002838 TaxID=3154436 RepID=UPI00331AE246
MLRYADPSAGQIRLGGVSLDQIASEVLFRTVGSVFQAALHHHHSGRNTLPRGRTHRRTRHTPGTSHHEPALRSTLASTQRRPHLATPRTMTTPRRSSGRPRILTEGDIIDAVLEEGFAGITVPAVARRLGVSTMTLYRYAPTRADLLALAWNHVITTTHWPPSADPGGRSFTPTQRRSGTSSPSIRGSSQNSPKPSCRPR